MCLYQQYKYGPYKQKNEYNVKHKHQDSSFSSEWVCISPKADKSISCFKKKTQDTHVKSFQHL